tara:strand:+ start:1693 stop:2370 length:678 start_codon:yes stop_codon:yes gene_type:complete
MATKSQHVYYVQNILNRGAKSDDARISNSLIAFTIDFVRALLIKRESNKYNHVSDANYQTVCVTLSEVDPTICSLPFTLPSRCRLTRSTTTIPKFLTAQWGDLSQVQYVDGRSIGKMSLPSSHRAEYSISLKDKVSYFFRDEYLYILNDLDLKKVQLSGIFEDPEEANTSSSCDPLSDEYPLDSHLVSALYDMVIQKLSAAQQFPQDNMNNTANDETISTQGNQK